MDRGFDEFFGYTNAKHAWEKFPKELWHGRAFTLFLRYDIEGPDAGERPTYAILARDTGLRVTDVTNELVTLILQENVSLRTNRAGDTLAFFEGESERLSGELDPIDLVIVYAAALIPIIYALLIFPKRDLAAPA